LAAAFTAMLAAPAHASGDELEILPDPARLLVLLVFFALLIPVLDRLMFKPLLAVLEEREQRIEGARARAEEVARDAAELALRHENAVREVRTASNAERQRGLEQARQQHQAAVGEARRTAEREMAAARVDVRAAVEAARGQLRLDAAPLAREVAERLLGRKLA
jgi:F-type H+-transporting ATPase subunit b